MSVVIDTSGFFALLLEADHNHDVAMAAWPQTRDEGLVTHGYVISEAIALIRSRLGWTGVEAFLDRVLPAVQVEIVDRDLHDIALAAYRRERGGTSFVDQVTIAFARRKGIQKAFAFDRDFDAAGLRFPG
jgi:predicted nucleic acid-binding protein